MAAKKRKRTRKPEKVVGTIKAGKVSINKTALKNFLYSLKKKGKDKPKVQFVARNAPFMRQPVPQV